MAIRHVSNILIHTHTHTHTHTDTHRQIDIDIDILFNWAVRMRITDWELLLYA
jgi:calcineurin-like phosphoesterase family protein